MIFFRKIAFYLHLMQVKKEMWSYVKGYFEGNERK